MSLWRRFGLWWPTGLVAFIVAVCVLQPFVM